MGDKLKTTLVLGSIAIAVVLMMVLADRVYSGNRLAPYPVPPGTTERFQALSQPTPDDVVLGKNDAPITVLEIASLTCPHCREFMGDTFPLIKTNWIDTGKVRWVFRDFPMDRPGLDAGTIIHCFEPEDRLQPIESLYRSQRDWALITDLDKMVQKLAQVTDLDPEKAKSCAANTELQNRIMQTRTDITDIGIAGTPAIIINGLEYVGSRPYQDYADIFTKMLDRH